MNMKQKIEKLTFNSSLAKFGKGLFETIKIHQGTPLLLDEHLERLFNSIQELGFDNLVSREELREEIIRACKGRGGEALRVAVCDEGYNFSFRKVKYDAGDYRCGFKVAISPVKRGESPLYCHKTSNYLENIYSLEKARGKGYDEALFLNQQQKVLECTLSNIFFIAGDVLYTPSTKDYILPGVMRRQVIEAANELGIKVVRRGIWYKEIDDFEFSFLTNSLVELIKVKEIEGTTYSNQDEKVQLKKDADVCKDNELFREINQKVKELVYERET